jgi:hypothetical protein
MKNSYEGLEAHTSSLIKAFIPVPPESYRRPPRPLGSIGMIMLVEYYYDGFFYSDIVWDKKFLIAREMGPSWKIQDRVTEKYNPIEKKYFTHRACYPQGEISTGYISSIEQHFTPY